MSLTECTFMRSRVIPVGPSSACKTYGGAVHAARSDVLLLNCSFLDNAVFGSGGALSAVQSFVKATQTLFGRNRATCAGGVLCCVRVHTV